MTKEEIIHAAWLETNPDINPQGFPSYNDEGWAKYVRKQESEWFKSLDEKEWLGYWFYRPESLRGIEKNNGWVKMNSRDDFPKFPERFAKFDLGIMNMDGNFIIERRSVGHTTLIRGFFHKGITYYREVVDVYPIYTN
jgi:hypothetical protein